MIVAYLARHAACVGSGIGVHEVDRYLTREGRAAAAGAARRMADRGAVPEVALTSPLARAVQTAELLVGALPFDGEVRTHPALLPGADPAETVEALREVACDALLVGHAPDMRRRAGTLLGEPFPPFAKCMVVAIELPRPGDPGRFLWAHLPGVEDAIETLAELREHRH